MFSFSSFGLPIVFAAVILLSVTAGVCCIWDMWGRPPSLESSPSETAEMPKLWDLLIEDPLGSNHAIWGELLILTAPSQPLSATLIRTESQAIHTGMTENDTAMDLRPMEPSGKAPETGNTSPSVSLADHLQIAVAIAMPSPPRPRNAPYDMTDDSLVPVYCIGLHQTTVSGSNDCVS
ncbi:hypothetical protein DFH06DRAFT_1127133 [Mycena polygramma]|nr:hypothetical protein DFH06DRAFT_1127133 [Mycena polygramma]